ncbi:MAG: CHASE3 domain-containing protein [Steroidobacterales bacterium]|jgi:signal transduction histidine kinase
MNSAARQLLLVGLLLATVIGLFVAAESGQGQLAEASRRVERSARRSNALGEILRVLIQAESGQRGYLLLGEPNYLLPYQEALAKVEPDLRELDAAFATSDAPTRASVAEIGSLSRAKFTEMGETLDLYRNHGRTSAIELMRTDFGYRAMSQITERVRQIQRAEADDMLQASRAWRTDRTVSFAIMSAALASSLFLVLLLRRVVLRYMSSKEREAERLAERQAELERVVKRRTEDLSELSTHLQSLAEQEKSALSRELHDELGGLLVAARMDVSWIEERVGGSDPELLTHFKRLQDALLEGVDLKRRVVENLRPTLLDNLGLIPALRWQVADSCGRAGLVCVEHYPPAPLNLLPEASIAIFRIVQESLTNILKHANARNVELAVESQGNWLVVTVRDDGVGLPDDRREALRSHGLSAMRHRAAALDGQFRASRLAAGGTQIEVRLPLERITATVPAY